MYIDTNKGIEYKIVEPQRIDVSILILQVVMCKIIKL